MRRARYWLAVKLVPEIAIWARPSSRLHAQATYDLLHREVRYVDDNTAGVLLRIAGAAK